MKNMLGNIDVETQPLGINFSHREDLREQGVY